MNGTVLKLGIVGLVLLATGCTTLANRNLPGATIVDEQLKSDTIKLINKQEKAYALLSDAGRPGGSGSSVFYLKVLDTRINYLPSASTNRRWSESWRIQRWGPDVDYRIVFTPDGVGGTYIQLSPPVEVKEPAEKSS